MFITISNSDQADAKSKNIWFPIDSEKLHEVCKALDIPLSINSNCFIVGLNDREMSRIIKTPYTCNIDELNFLMKRLDSFDAREKDTFYASAVGLGKTELKDLINLTYNTHCYSVISDFSNLNRVGKMIYLNEAGGVPTGELSDLDGHKIVEEILMYSPIKAITPYGVLLQNRNEPELVYDGKHFPLYFHQNEVATFVISAKGERAFVYLPCFDIEIQKALLRLDEQDLSECQVVLESDTFPSVLMALIEKEDVLSQRLDLVNDFAKSIKQLGVRDTEYYGKLLDYLRPISVVDARLLLEHFHEFQVFDGICDAKAYGKFMLCESGRIEYDESLEDYIDFQSYGEKKLKSECGAFTEKGYLIYFGSNPEVNRILFESLGLIVEAPMEQLELKLYMPLKAITYDVENDYGYTETSDEAEEISAQELLKYEDDILMVIEKLKYPEEVNRGLMKYYDHKDTVNAKVSKYDITVQEVNGVLMGVAVLALNAPLTDAELERIKEEITGQMSDGWGESMEQREIKTGDKDIFVSFWNSEDWSLKTAEDLGMIDQTLTIKGLGL